MGPNLSQVLGGPELARPLPYPQRPGPQTSFFFFLLLHHHHQPDANSAAEPRGQGEPTASLNFLEVPLFASDGTDKVKFEIFD